MYSGRRKKQGSWSQEVRGKNLNTTHSLSGKIADVGGAQGTSHIRRQRLKAEREQTQGKEEEPREHVKKRGVERR